MPRYWPQVSLSVGLILVATCSGALVAWALWPIECGQTLVGIVPGEADPNIHACTTRIGTIVSLDAARVSAALWGEAAGAGVLLAGGLAAWLLGPLRTLPARAMTGALARTVAVLGGALVLGLLVVWALWPTDCIVSLRAILEAGRPLLCSTGIGVVVPRETARLHALLWGQGVAAVIVTGYIALAWTRSRRAAT